MVSSIAKWIWLPGWRRLLIGGVMLATLLTFVGDNVFLRLLAWVAIVGVWSYCTPWVRQNAIRRPFLTFLILSAGFIAFVGLLLRYSFPPSFTQLSDVATSKYDGRATGQMTLFLVTVTGENQRTAIENFALSALPFFPLIPASLFLAIAVSCHRRLPTTPFGTNVIGSLTDTAKQIRERSTPVGQAAKHASSLRTWVTAKGHRQKVAALLAFSLPCLIAVAAIRQITGPRIATVFSTLLSALVAFAIYSLSCVRPPDDRQRGDLPCCHRPAKRADPILVKILAPLVAIILYGASVWFVADSRRMIAEMANKYPSPHGPVDMRTINDSTAQAIDHLAKLINSADPSRPDDVKAIRDDTRQVVRNIAAAMPADYTVVNLCRAAWFIFWVICALAVWIFSDREQLGSLLFVTTAYVAVGLSFGMIYYDYYLGDVAAFNFLVNTFGNNRQIDALRTRYAKLTRDEREERAHDLPLFRAQARVQERSFNSLMRTKFFATSVFAQDEPQLSVDATVPQRPQVIFEGTFQFERNAYVSLPATKLAYLAAPAKISGNGNDNDDDQAAGNPRRAFTVDQCSSVALSSLSTGSARSWTSGDDGTNYDSARRLMTVICHEARKDRGAGSRGYEIEVVGGADCEGTEAANAGLSEKRRQNIIERIQQMLEALDKRFPNNERLADFRMSVQARAIVPHVQPKASGVCDSAARGWKSLWPAGLQDRREKELNKWRAAAVTVKAFELDSSQSLRMAGGFSIDTSLADMMYFSFVSFTTTGYGDIKPVSGAVRFCVILENILEIIFAAFFFVAAMNAEYSA